MRFLKHILCYFLTLAFIVTGLSGHSFAQDETPQNIEPAPIKEEHLVEAEYFFRYCDRTPKFYKYYNCECLAAEYLDTRIQRGDDISQSRIILAIEDRCADATRAAGSYYQTCLGNSVLLPSNQSPEEYCTCYANTFAQLYERAGETPGSRVFVQLQTAAHAQCQRAPRR